MTVVKVLPYTLIEQEGRGVFLVDVPTDGRRPRLQLVAADYNYPGEDLGAVAARVAAINNLEVAS